MIFILVVLGIMVWRGDAALGFEQLEVEFGLVVLEGKERTHIIDDSLVDSSLIKS